MTKLQAENCQLKWELKFLRKQLKNSSLAIEGYEFKINKLMGHNYIKDDIILELENKIIDLKNQIKVLKNKK